MDAELLALSGGFLSTVFLLLSAAEAVFSFNLSEVVKRRNQAESLLVDTRYSELRREYRRQISASRVFRATSALLFFFQIVLGGVLAAMSSTSSDSVLVDDHAVRWMGLFVIAATLMREYYRPYTGYLHALTLALDLSKLLRRVENDLYLMRSESPEKKTVQEVRAYVSSELDTYYYNELKAKLVSKQREAHVQ